jgi:serine/threonine protein kinase
MQLEPGENLGDYRISAVLGEGGSAVVYAAEHLRAGRKVALKVFKQEVVQNHLLMQRIKREALIVNRVRHPSMVEIFDLVEIADRKPALCVLVMELLQGRCLDDLLQREGVLEPEDAVTIAAQVANALIALHNEKILHRDVKPQNIFLVDVPDQDPQVKLMDLGIAKGFGTLHKTNITGAGQAVGTPEYMAPEQFLSKEMDERTDIYSLGATLYQMLAGTPPLGLPGDAGSLGDFLVKLLKSPPPPIRERQPAVPRALESVVMRCLSKDPGERYQTVLELRDALLGSLGTRSVEGGESARRFKPGDKLGGYVITGVLAEGGTSMVCSAQDPRTGRDVALKVLNPEMVQTATVRSRFIREAMVVSGIDHPNIVKIYDFVDAVEGGERLVYTVMELLKGGDVASLVAKAGVLDPEAAVAIGKQVVQALCTVHQAKVLHRDLKSENIFLVEQPPGRGFQVKLLDFGLVKAFGDRVQVSLTAAGMAVGTPEFMAPEQILGHEMDERADIYSFGATLYDMLTGVPPFGLAEGDYGDVVLRHINEAPRPIAERRRSGRPVPAALEAVVMRCLEKDPANRFQSAEELYQALESCLEAGAVGSGPSLRSVIDRPAASPARSRRWLVAALAAVLVVGGAGLVAAWLVARGDQPAAATVKTPRPDVEPARPVPAPIASEVGSPDGAVAASLPAAPAKAAGVEGPPKAKQVRGKRRPRRRAFTRKKRRRARKGRGKRDASGTLNPFEGRR